MDSPVWAKRIEAAKTVEEVLQLASRYVASRPADQLALVPDECRLPDAFTPAELADCAYRLAAYHGHDDAARVIHRFASVLSRASVRIAELARLKDPPTYP